MAIQESIIHTVNPITSINSSKAHESPIDFVIASNVDLLLDISNLFLEIKGQIVTDDEAKFVDADEVKPIKSLLNTLFSDIEIRLNDVLITSTSGNHPYRAFIEQELSYSEDAKKTQLAADGYYHNEETMLATYNKAKNEKNVNLYGRLHLDLLSQSKVLPGGVSVKLRLNRKKPEFYLICNASCAAKNPYLRINEAILHVKKYRLTASTFMEMERTLLKHKAVYPLQNAQVRSFSLSPGQQSFELANVILGKLPDKVIAGFVSHSSMIGDYLTDPLKFGPHDLTSFKIFIDGNQFGLGFDTNYSNTHLPDCIRAFNSISQILNLADTGNGISLDRYYRGGLTLYAFDLTRDMSGQTCLYQNPIRSGILSVKLNFSKPLTQALNLVMYLDMKEYITIDFKRHVTKTE